MAASTRIDSPAGHSIRALCVRRPIVSTHTDPHARSTSGLARALTDDGPLVAPSAYADADPNRIARLCERPHIAHRDRAAAYAWRRELQARDTRNRATILQLNRRYAEADIASPRASRCIIVRRAEGHSTHTTHDTHDAPERSAEITLQTNTRTHIRQTTDDQRTATDATVRPHASYSPPSPRHPPPIPGYCHELVRTRLLTSPPSPSPHATSSLPTRNHNPIRTEHETNRNVLPATDRSSMCDVGRDAKAEERRDEKRRERRTQQTVEQRTKNGDSKRRDE